MAEAKKVPLLVVMDGYDEIKATKNIYQLSCLAQWDLKLIITCRT